MADVAPWLVPQSTGAPNVAPWLQQEEQPGYAEDILKAIPSGVAKGVISIPGTPGDVAALAKAGADKVTEKTGAPDPLGWVTHKLDENFPNAMNFLRASNAKSANAPAAQVGSGDLPGSYEMPTSKDIQGQLEKVTGPLYEAKTGPGKAVQTATEIAPSLAMGGASTLPGIAAKAAGAGVGSELAGEGANAIKGHLPTSVAPYVEPVARAVGAGVGMFAPGMARTAVTPLPMTDARMNTVNALRQVNPELVEASTAGQLTQSPRIAGLEARAPGMADLPARQDAAYTQGVMRQLGSDGMFDTPGLAQAKARGDELRTLQNAHEMNPSQYGLLNQYAGTRNTPGSELYKAVGPSKPYQDVVDALKNGPGGGNPAPMSMTGPRYGAMKQIVQDAGKAAPTTHEQSAIFDLRNRMKTAFQNSMPDAEAQRLRDLDKNYSNYKSIEGLNPGVGKNTVSPSDVFNKVDRGSDLENHATEAAKVMTPLPEPNHEGGFGTKVVGGLLGLAAGGGAGALAHSGVAAAEAAPFTSYYGFNHMNDVVQAAKNAAGRVVARPGTQSYLANQTWRPSVNSVTTRDDLIRALMAPPAKGNSSK